MNGVVVVKADLVPAAEALARAGGFVGMDPTTPADYLPIAEIDIPGAPSYALSEVDLGAEFLDVAPDDALPRILERGRSPLTIEEGIAVLAQFPGRAEDGERVLPARLAPRRSPRSRPLAQRRPAEARLVLGGRAALVARLGLVRRARSRGLVRFCGRRLAGSFGGRVRPRAQQHGAETRGRGCEDRADEEGEVVAAGER